MKRGLDINWYANGSMLIKDDRGIIYDGKDSDKNMPVHVREALIEGLKSRIETLQRIQK